MYKVEGKFQRPLRIKNRNLSVFCWNRHINFYRSKINWLDLNNIKYLDFNTFTRRFNYGIIMESDATENKQREMLDLCQVRD